MDTQLQEKTALVTGGASGIGEAIVKLLASEGARVAIVDRDSEKGRRLVELLRQQGQHALCVTADLGEEDDCRRAVEETVAAFGGLEILVNNAGVNDGVNIDQPLEHFVGSLRSNLFHVFSVTHYALPHLKRLRGSIVNITSKVATTGQGGTSGYAAAKGAINALTREWAVELAADGIRVNSVAPAEVMTPMYEQWLQSLDDAVSRQAQIESLIPLGRRFTTAEEIAATAVFLASPLASHTTGQILHPDGGYVHLDRAKTNE